MSGTSAGAVNAVLLADGLCRGGPAEAAAQLDRFWHRLSTMAGPVPFGAWSAAAAAMGFSARQASPYRLNPFGINPLRDMLAAEIDFARLRVASPLRLLIAATNVRTGQARMFREHEITVDAVLASACLPFLHQAVEIDGEAYWDGAYSANPPLRALIAHCDADDIVLVRLTPEHLDAVPRRPRTSPTAWTRSSSMRRYAARSRPSPSCAARRARTCYRRAGSAGCGGCASTPLPPPTARPSFCRPARSISTGHS